MTQNLNVSIVKHLGSDLLLIDYTKCKAQQELLEVLQEAVRVIEQHGSIDLCLIDVTGISAGSEFINQVKKYSKEVFSKRVNKTAIIGMTPIQQILVKAVNRFLTKASIVPFSTKEEALGFLGKK